MATLCRYELEKQLIEGSVRTKDLPELWRSRMYELLACTPKNDAEGCLQDVHWSVGAIGYFPTYSLGKPYDAPLALPGG